MKFKISSIKICAAIVLGIIIFGFTMSSLDTAITKYEIQDRQLSCFPKQSSFVSTERLISEISQTQSRPLAYLFQILIILFIVSPPIMTLMLFLIWRELKARNKMK